MGAGDLGVLRYRLSAACCSEVQGGTSCPKGLLGPGLLLLTPHPLSLLVPDVNSRSARVLFLLVVPGHLVFLYTISCMQGGHTTLTLIFIIFYMTAALLQVQTGRSVGRTCHPLHHLFLCD